MRYIVSFLFLFLLIGCVNKNNEEVSKLLTPNIQQDSLDDVVNNLSEQLFNSFYDYNQTQNMIITSLVDLRDFTQTNTFGQIVSESLYNDIHNKGLKVIDFRGQSNISVNENGEFHLTRDLDKLKDEIVDVEYILVGTYTQYENESILVNVRIMDIESGKVKSTAKYVYKPSDCKEYNICTHDSKTTEIKPIESIMIQADEN